MGDGILWHLVGADLARSLAIALLFGLLVLARSRLGTDSKFGPILWGLLLVLAASLVETLILWRGLPGGLLWANLLVYLTGLLLLAKGIFDWAAWVTQLKAHSGERDALLERVQKQAALLAESHHVARIGFLVADLELTRIRWNGYGLEEITTAAGAADRAMLEAGLIHPDDRSAFARAHAALRREGRQVVDLRLRGHDGQYRWYRTAARTEDHAGRLFAVVQDIDAMKRSHLARDEALREAQAASQAKTSFLATMSHELRTPLNAVLGFSEIIMNQIAGNAPPRYVEYAHEIHQAGSDLLEIIDKVLEVVRIDSGKRPLETELLSPREEIDTVLAGFAAPARQQGIVFSVDDDGSTGECRLDGGILREVLQHVIGNAVKFNRNGGRVDLRLRPLGDDGVSIAVSDTGIGIQPDHLGRVFDLFWQSESGFVRHHGGTGLGLAIARRLCALHHGSIAVDSTPNLGTTVTITLRSRPPAGDGSITPGMQAAE